MAAEQGLASNSDAFDVYFRRADLDQDGRISGAEAVSFFQGSNLPKETLALVWSYAANGNNFLGRAEFFNALRLATVAQSGRQLTADIVKAALYGPAAAKIPAPKIASSPSSSSSQANQMGMQGTQSGFMRPPASQMNSMAVSSPLPNSISSPIPAAPIQQSLQPGYMRPPSQMNSLSGVPHQSSSQTGFIKSSSQLNSMPLNHHVSPSAQNNFMRPPQTPQFAASHPVQGFTKGFNPSDKVGFGMPHASQEAASKPQIQHETPYSPHSRVVDPVPIVFQTTSKDSNELSVPENNFLANPMFGGDIFSATSDNTTPKNLQNSFQNAQHQGFLAIPAAPNQLPRAPAVPASSVLSSPDSSVHAQNEVPWPKITQSDIRKYTKVFMEVDKNRDGKITGVEARNLFLSWRLPRDVLRQVWDLSDQDNDSMLSMREFCVALYLMERHREGRPLPSFLPNSVKFDQILIIATGQPPATYGAPAWQPRPVLPQQPISEPPSVVPPIRVEPYARNLAPFKTDDATSPVQQKLKVTALEENIVNQLSEEEQKALSSKLQEATEADNKVKELEKEILDCKQKTESYHKQMQELVLYKSRCDSRLNETIERSAADKVEADLLSRKYEEKVKQMGDVVSKLNVDQSTFRDIQERKMELYNAIAKMEQGEISDGALQKRAEKIQADLDELVKALNEWCKDSGLRAKPTSLAELPFGWQVGIQEGTADWDESWDMFDKDDGFTIIKEITLEVENVVAPEKLKPIAATTITEDLVAPTPSNEGDKADKEDEHSSFSKFDGKIEEPLSEVSLNKSEFTNVHGEDDFLRSPSVSPGRSSLESPSQEIQSSFSPRVGTIDHHSEFDGAESMISGDKFTNDITWGATFDSDDTDSLWGFNPIKTQEGFNDNSSRGDYFSGPGDLSLNSLGPDSPSAASIFGKEKGPFFDSVPSTPAYTSVFSPKFGDSFSRFDSFSTQDSIFPSSSLNRFDSIRSSTGSFSRFDSFGTVDTQREFARFDSMRGPAEAPRETLARFDSIRSTGDYNQGFSFDDSDTFGSEPFKTSDESYKKSTTDHWSSF